MHHSCQEAGSSELKPVPNRSFAEKSLTETETLEERYDNFRKILEDFNGGSRGISEVRNLEEILSSRFVKEVLINGVECVYLESRLIETDVANNFLRFSDNNRRFLPYHIYAITVSEKDAPALRILAKKDCENGASAWSDIGFLTIENIQELAVRKICGSPFMCNVVVIRKGEMP